jgi:sugar lactone lactonase YvrE
MATIALKFFLFWNVIVFCCASSQKSSLSEDDVPGSKLPNYVVGRLMEPSNDLMTTATASASATRSVMFPSFSTLESELDYIRTLAGTGIAGYNGDNINATKARLNYPVDLAVDRSGDIYIADDANNRIRKLTVSTGILTTVAGTGLTTYNGDDIDATTAAINTPEGVSVDGVGNIYIADSVNHRLRKVTVSTGKITTVAGTGIPGSGKDGILATTSNLYRPAGLAVDVEDNIYIADSSNHRIRKVSASTRLITTVAGTGISSYNGDNIDATTAQLSYPFAVAVDKVGDIYIADTYNNRIRKVTISTGKITTIAGTGVSGFNADGIDATTATLNNPKGVAVDRAGNVFIADSGHYRIRKVIVSTGKITTIAGTGIAGFTGDGVIAINARLNYVTAIAVDGVDNFYIADTSNHRIRSMTGALRTGSPSIAPSIAPRTSPPSTVPVDDATSPPSTVPVDDSTSPPSTVPVDDSTSPPSTVPVQPSTSPPSTVPVDDSTSPPSTVPVQPSTSPPSTVPVDDSTSPPSTVPVDDSTSPPTTSEDPAVPTCPTKKPTCPVSRKPRCPRPEKTPKSSLAPRMCKPKNKKGTKKPTTAPV